MPADAPHRHTVRPRWSWGGLLGLVVGTCVTGYGVVTMSLTWIIPGVVVLGAGGLAALHGGMFYDVHRGVTLRRELHDVQTGNTRQAPGPEARVTDEESQADAAGDARRTRRLLRAGPARVPGLRPVGVLLLTVTATWLVLTQGAYYPNTPEGRGDALRDLGLAIVLALAALSLALRGPGLVAVTASGLAGLGLLLAGTVFADASTYATVSETVCGAAACLGAALSLHHRGARTHPATGTSPATTTTTKTPTTPTTTTRTRR